MKPLARKIKQDQYQRRFYRQWVNAGDLLKTRIILEETDLLILSPSRLDAKFVRERIYCFRQDIKDYIIKDKRFAFSLKPLTVEIHSPPIIRLMAGAAEICNVGPMASVAGSIAQLLALDLERRGHREVIIENGGDIFISRQKKERSVAVFAGQRKIQWG
ncbi:UPF0280 family protein, partial [Candidatus Omnitrophota bacterium]